MGNDECEVSRVTAMSENELQIEVSEELLREIILEDYVLKVLERKINAVLNYAVYHFRGLPVKFGISYADGHLIFVIRIDVTKIMESEKELRKGQVKDQLEYQERLQERQQRRLKRVPELPQRTQEQRGESGTQ